MGLPTNVVDAAAAIKNGELGFFEEVSIGDLVVSALTELSVPDDSVITERPVESGFTIIEATVDTPLIATGTCVFTNPDFSVESGVTAALNGSVSQFTETWLDKKNRLYEMKRDKEIVTFTTHADELPNMIVKRIDPIYNVEENWEAFIASVTLQQVDERQTAAADSLLGALTSGLSSVGGM